MLPPPARPAFSRTLFLPGPLPPLSHCGVTLLRYCLGTGLRYVLYHLGLPVPEAPLVSIVRLRPYWDARGLRDLLTGEPGGEDVLGALLEPGGTAVLPAIHPQLSAAVAFHRLRLAAGRAALPGSEPPGPDESGPAVRQRLRRDLSRGLAKVNDALLAEVVSALLRRSLRARGEEAVPVLSRGAWALRKGRPRALARFGLPDPLAPSWRETPAAAEEARRALALHPLPPRDALRGRFREVYRSLLTSLAPLFARLARRGTESGSLARAEDFFFLPWETGEDLVSDRRLDWVEGAVFNNRAEHASLTDAAEPLDEMTVRQEMTELQGDRPEWRWGPLLPLP